MIAAGLPPLTIHPLLHDRPLSVVGHNEAMQIKVESILNGCAINFGDQSAGPRQACAVDPDALAYREQLLRRLSGVFPASAANVNAEFTLNGSQSPLQRTNHARGYSRGMPVHSHHNSERLKPEWVGEPAQKLVATIMMNDGLSDHCAETRHSTGKPAWYVAAVERKISASGATRHYGSFDSRKLLKVTE
jgi:hypothetical protein